MAKFKIDGPEARGYAEITTENGNIFLLLSELWIAPGAPDVQVALSSNEEGKLDDSLQHIAFLPYGKTEFRYNLSALNLDIAKTVIVYCTQYYVHFGHGTIKLT